MSPAQIVLFYNLVMFTLVAGALALVWRQDLPSGPMPLLAPVTGLLFVGTLGALASPMPGFGKLQLLAWTAFAHLPILLFGEAYVFSKGAPAVARACTGLAIATLAVGTDAFLVEPHWLAVDRLTLSTPKLDRRVRIAIVADIQTDAPGAYEKRVLRRVMAEEPDLILLAGDYIHVADGDQYRAAGRRLNEMMREVELDAQLGIYAVRGNVDWPGEWQGIFAGLPVSALDRSQTFDVGPLALTELTLQDSADTHLTISPQDAFHIVLGHTPNFSLGKMEADLLVAGHTHGGQIRLPFVGPVITLSEVPRGWASGVTRMASGQTLIVSRGIRMERGHAPRMRFLCRPQLVIVDLVGVGA